MYLQSRPPRHVISTHWPPTFQLKSGRRYWHRLNRWPANDSQNHPIWERSGFKLRKPFAPSTPASIACISLGLAISVSLPQ